MYLQPLNVPNIPELDSVLLMRMEALEGMSAAQLVTVLHKVKEHSVVDRVLQIRTSPAQQNLVVVKLLETLKHIVLLPPL